MKFFISILILSSITLKGYTQEIERKIIIENGKYYYTTIDEQYQIATMHTGDVGSALKESKNLAMPAGRNYNDPIIPFSWDICRDQVYAINFLVHPLNDRNESLKKFSFGSLKEWDKSITIQDMIMLSTDYTPFARFEPYMNITHQSKILNNFYFDGIAINDTTYNMVISNKDEISFWSFNSKYWIQSNVWKLTALNYFSLFSWNDKTYMYAWDGTIYKMGMEKMTPVAMIADTPPLKDGLLVINRDKNTVSFLKSGVMDKETPLNEIIEKNAVTLFESNKKK